MSCSREGTGSPLLNHPLRGSVSEGEYCQRRIQPSRGDKNTAASNEEIGHFVGLAVLVYHRPRRIIAHPLTQASTLACFCNISVWQKVQDCDWSPRRSPQFIASFSEKREASHSVSHSLGKSLYLDEL